MQKINETKRAVKLIRAAGVARAGELSDHRIRPITLRRLVERGVVERDGRWRYRLAGAGVGENYSLIQTAKRIPKGVICLPSALRFHELATQKPFEVWMAIERGTRHQAMDAPPLRVHYFSGEALTAGIEDHKTDRALDNAIEQGALFCNMLAENH